MSLFSFGICFFLLIVEFKTIFKVSFFDRKIFWLREKKTNGKKREKKKKTEKKELNKNKRNEIKKRKSRKKKNRRNHLILLLLLSLH